MAYGSRNLPDSFNPNVKIEFHYHLKSNPSNRRVSSAEKLNLIEWLTDPNTHPSSQKEFSRRNYVRKTFRWDHVEHDLQAIPRKVGEKERKVVTDDSIVDTVWSVHTNNEHSGWDATWKTVSSLYYGILRADVIFLLQRCEICAQDPRKRPKGSSTSNTLSDFGEHHTTQF
ncbi:hypothetical protein F5B18DRAFT_599103 [Nemania serpens]|nr:hypothetical protein F5B18DRAFT_599103 [Nemania serpens]